MSNGRVPSGSLRSKITDEHLTCSICFNNFDHPKALPCLHTFCRDCLRDYVVGRGYEEPGKFPCPVCRMEIQLPPEGVQGFPDNHFVVSLLDTVENARKSPVVPPRPANYSPRSSETEQPNLPAPPGIHSVDSGLGQATNLPNVGGLALSTPVYPQRRADSPYERTSSPGLYPHLSANSSEPCTKHMVLQFGKYGPGVNEFLKPYGLAVGRNGEYVITDKGGSRVFVYTNSGQPQTRFNCDCAINDVAITKDNNILIAVSKSKSSIMRQYSMDGRFQHAFGDFYKFDNPSGITVTPKNLVAITNLSADNVLVFTDQRKFSTKFGWKGLGDKHFMQPKFIASTSKDYVVVSDTGSHTIKILDSAGNFKRSFGGSGSNHGCLNNPLGVAVDAEDNIIIADSNNSRVEIYTVKGHFYTTLVENTNLLAPDVKPINVAVTPRNNIAVLFAGTGFTEVRVYHWKPAEYCHDGMSRV